MNTNRLDNDTLSCTIIGTALVLLYSINPTELLTAVVIAATGTVVSFLVSVFCKFVWRKIKEE